VASNDSDPTPSTNPPAASPPSPPIHPSTAHSRVGSRPATDPPELPDNPHQPTANQPTGNQPAAEPTAAESDRTSPAPTTPRSTAPRSTAPGGIRGSGGRRPLIGITSYLERARFGIWDLDAALLPRDYTDSVVRAGGIPVLLPPTGDGFAELVARLDGLVLAGGADVDPARYRQPSHPETAGLRPDRDAFEFGLLAEALTAGLPVLAVCRGMQLLNSALGGTLHQHLPEHVGHAGHRPEPGVFGTCRVTIAGDSRLAAAFGAETKVHCHHHQAVDVVAPGLTVVGTADDGTVEAVELTGGGFGGFVVGVQWHPEQDSGDDRLVAALVREASGRATR
jgi:putative glutamine amidotransferase